MDQVINQASAVAMAHGQDFMLTVGIERRVGKLGRIGGLGIKRRLAPCVANPERAAAIR